MKLQDQVCTLEQSKKLDELEIEYEEPKFVHFLTIENEDYAWKLDTFGKSGDSLESYPAFTVAELGQMLPTLGIKRYKSNNGMGSDYHWLEYKSQDWSDLNEAQLLAKFIIYLLENNLATAEQINSQLNA